MASNGVGTLKKNPLWNVMNLCAGSKFPHTEHCIYYDKEFCFVHKIVNNKLFSVLELTSVIIVYPTQTHLSL